MKNKIKKEVREGNYKKCWRYLKESKIYFLIILALFSISVLIGFFFPVFFVELIKKLIEELVKKTEGMNFYQLFVFIFKNNITTAFIAVLSGIFLGLLPLILTLFNGYVLGFVAGKTADVFGNSILLRLLPHGIFEIPALILSLGLGLKLGMFIFAKNKKEKLKYDFENSFRCFVFVIIPLLLIAGLIEAGLIFLLG